jgi:hypothetical protein
MSGRVYLLGVGVMLVALAFVVCDHLLRDPISPGTYRRILSCVTAEEVQTVIGLPSEAEFGVAPREKLTLVEGGADNIGRFGNRLWLRSWRGRDWLITVYVDKRGVVVSRELCRITRPEQPGPLSRLCAWIGW